MGKLDKKMKKKKKGKREGSEIKEKLEEEEKKVSPKEEGEYISTRQATRASRNQNQKKKSEAVRSISPPSVVIHQPNVDTKANKGSFVEVKQSRRARN